MKNITREPPRKDPYIGKIVTILHKNKTEQVYVIEETDTTVTGFMCPFNKRREKSTISLIKDGNKNNIYASTKVIPKYIRNTLFKYILVSAEESSKLFGFGNLKKRYLNQELKVVDYMEQFLCKDGIPRNICLVEITNLSGQTSTLKFVESDFKIVLPNIKGFNEKKDKETYAIGRVVKIKNLRDIKILKPELKIGEKLVILDIKKNLKTFQHNLIYCSPLDQTKHNNIYKIYQKSLRLC